MKSSKILLFVLILILFGNVSFAYEHLDTGGKNEPYYICSLKLSEQGAFGTEPFFISMTGVCAIRSSYGVAGWEDLYLGWHQVTVSGIYDYGSHIAEEAIKVKGQTVFMVKLSCSKNPWAHGVWVNGSTCSTTGEPINNIGTMVNDADVRVHGPYPLSARFMDYSTQAAIAKGEETNFKSAEELAEELLGDWKPYGQPGGESALVIKKPDDFEMIDQNLDHYDFEVEKKPGFQELGWIKIWIEHLEEVPDVIGDIVILDTYTHWWQPFWSIPYPADVSPLSVGISKFPFANKPGVYRFRMNSGYAPYSKKHTYGYSSWRHFCVGQPGGICVNSNLVKVGQTTEVIKKIQAINLIFNQESKDIKVDQAKKKQKIVAQLTGKKTGLLSPSSQAGTEKLTKKQPLMKKLPGKETADVQLPKAALQDIKISVVSSKDRDNVLTIKLKNSSLKTLNRYTVEIQSLRNDKTIWNTAMSFFPGMKILKIDHKDLDLKFQPKGKRAYHILINKNSIGTIFIHNGIQFQKTMKTVALPLKPKLKIDLSLKTKNLKAGDKATILVSVKNNGKGTLNKTESYSLQCVPGCPFSKSRGKLNAELKPGDSSTLSLTSKNLDAGEYNVTVKTKFGSSKKLKFKVKSVRSRQRSPSSTRPIPSGARQRQDN